MRPGQSILGPRSGGFHGRWWAADFTTYIILLRLSLHLEPGVGPSVAEDLWLWAEQAQGRLSKDGMSWGLYPPWSTWHGTAGE